MKGALIGCGYISHFHMEAWRRIPEAEIIAVCDLNERAARSLAGEFDIAKVYNSPELLLQEVPLHFVDIATRPPSHEPLVTLAAGHGVHVICQKPFAPTLEAAERMVQACEEASVTLMVNENTRWLEPFRQTKTMLRDGTLGQPFYARFHLHSGFARPLPDGSKPPHLTGAGQPYLAEMEQAVFYETAIHCVDVARFLFGEVQSIYARLGRMSPYMKGEDQSLAILDVDGVTVLIDVTWASPVDPQIHRDPFFLLETSKGAAAAWLAESVQLEAGDFKLVLNGEPAQQLPPSGPEGVYLPFVRAQRHFVQCLQSRTKPETDGYDNLKTLRTTLAAYTSQERGEVVHLDGNRA